MPGCPWGCRKGHICAGEKSTKRKTVMSPAQGKRSWGTCCARQVSGLPPRPSHPTPSNCQVEVWTGGLCVDHTTLGLLPWSTPKVLATPTPLSGGTGARSCKDVLAQGNFLTGWYTIYLPDCRLLTVLCDMDVDGGGWTVSREPRHGVGEVCSGQSRSGEPKAGSH
jgi:hypothetical protein